MAPFSKPETVLKQAEGLVAVGQHHAALQSLSEMFTSKRFRSTPLATLEPIMHRFVELCVEKRKGRTAKEGLMQYKNIAQNTSVQSIESVIVKFIQLADAKVREAQEAAAAIQATQTAVDGAEVDDLEASETPESILLGAVSGDQSKDRTDRALVTPWLKFLWESYRTSLETLKNNARLEVIYQQIAQQAFKFCLTHSRKVEFRRLCETLRLHLANTAKYSHQQHSINLSDPETLQHHLDTRFAQLNTSVELEQWQEAFRSVEDVHNLLMMAKEKGSGAGGKPGFGVKTTMMAGYYEKLTRIFLVGGNALFHAAAWGRYYAMVTSIGGKSPEEMGKLAGQVLVSALAVPVGLNEHEGGTSSEEGKGRNARLTTLLGLSKMPTRAGLLKDALSRDVLKLSPESVKSLYTHLEITFSPLSLPASITPLLVSLSAPSSSSAPNPYAPYVPLLQRALLSRLLSQLSQVYSTIKVEKLLELVKPLREAALEGEDIFGEEQVEAYVMGCARRGELSIKVDHKEGSITFVDDAFGSDGESSGSSSKETTIQPSTAELVSTRLSKLATSLHNSLAILYPPPSTSLSSEEQQSQFATLVTAANAERKALHLRRALVARRRELLSELSVRKEKEEASRRAEVSRKNKEEESKRATEEEKRKVLERARKVFEDARTEEARKLAESLRKTGGLKVAIDEMEDINTDSLMRLQIEQLEKEKNTINERLRVIAKRVDHVERAFRKEERPLLAKDYELQQINDRQTFETIQKERIETSKITHTQNLETKKRLARMLDDYQAHKKVLVAKKGEEYKKLQEEVAKKIEKEKAARRKRVLDEREKERLRAEEEERVRREREAEEERLQAERAAEEERIREEEAAVAEAAEAKKREEEEKAAASRKQRELERAEAAEKARLQAQREEEAAARAAARRAKPLTPSAPSAAAAPIRVANGETSTWRSKAALNKDIPPPSTRPATANVTPPRTESPAPPTFKPKVGGGGGGGGWRERELAKASGAPPPVASPTLPPVAKDEPKKDDDGFQAVGAKAVWKPKARRG